MSTDTPTASPALGPTAPAPAAPAAGTPAAPKGGAAPAPKEGAPKEVGGPTGPDPTRFGDWERKGRCIDF